VTAASSIGGSIHGFVAGTKAKEVAREAAKVDGVEKIIVVENAAYDKVWEFDSSLRSGHGRAPHSVIVSANSISTHA
jgi:hypothetical protein